MDLFEDFRLRATAILQHLRVSGRWPLALDPARIVSRPPRRHEPHACDVVIDTGGLRRSPHAPEITTALAHHLALDPDVASATIATGFINLVLRPHCLGAALATALRSGDAYGRGAGRPPLHVTVQGTAATPMGEDPDRVGVVAQAIAALLAHAGHPVDVEHAATPPTVQGGMGLIAICDMSGRGPLEPESLTKGRIAVRPCRLYGGGLPDGQPCSEREGSLDAEHRAAVRFAMLSQRSDLALSIDVDRVTDRSYSAPLFAVRYAHARAHAVLRDVRVSWPDLDVTPAALAESDFTLLDDAGEQAIIGAIVRYPRIVAVAAERCEPHRLALLLHELANAVHRQWNRSKDQPQKRFVNEEQRDLTKARLGLMTASTFVLASGLGIFDIEAPDEIR